MYLYLSLLLYVGVLMLLFYFDYSRNKNIASPIGYFIIMEIVRELPFTYFIIGDRSIIREQAYYNFYYNFDNVFIKYLVIKCIFLLVYYFINKIIISKNNILNDEVIYPKRSVVRTCIPLMFIGIVCYIFFIVKNGGVSVLLSNMSNRAQLFRGSSFVFIFFNMWLFSIFLLFNNYSNKKYRRIFFIMITIYVICMFVFGGRAQILQPVLMTILIYSIKIKRVKIRSYKTLLALIATIVFIFGYSLLRQPGAIGYYLNEPKQLINDVIDESKELSVELSSVDRQMFVINKFNSNNYWYMKNILLIPKAFIPSSIYSDKPPVDDGVYIWNLAIGNDVEIGSPYEIMAKNSWPLTSLSSGYANLGILGVVIFAIIHSSIVSVLYKKAINKKDLISILFYVSVLTTLQIASLQIVQTVTNIIPIIIIYMLLVFFTKVRIIK